jgi:hypothetical protein
MSFDENMILCYKGVEINESGDVFDKEIKHGLSTAVCSSKIIHSTGFVHRRWSWR